MMLSVAAVLEEAKSTDTNALIAAMKGLTHDTPMGPITYRDADHQATMGSWVGKTDVIDGKGKMTNWRFIDGASVLPSLEDAKAMRPKG
jgi:branched-chain amino acid transport system substrate-binding protein